MRKHRDRRGVATILVVGVLAVFLIFFLVVGIDFAYIYVVRGQVQNATDAAALAGVVKLSSALDESSAAYLQNDAREEAWEFACKNLAAADKVYLVGGLGNDCDDPPADLNDSNAAGGDIVVGNWDDDTRTFTPADGTTGLSINALKTVARRMNEHPETGGNVGLLFGRLVDWDAMDIAQVAIAASNPPTILPLPVCLPTCDLETPLDGKWGYDKHKDNENPILCSDDDLTGSQDAPGQQMFVAPSSQDETVPLPGLAWTNFAIRDCPANNCDTPNRDEVIPYITGQKRTPDICGKHICTTNGTITPLFQILKEQFEAKKRVHTVGGEDIEGWRVLVPIVSNLSCGEPKQSCPGAQAGEANPYLVQGMAELIVTEVITTGPKGIRVIGLGEPSEKTYTVNCKTGTTTFTRNVSTIAGSSGLCTDCSLPLPTGGATARLVR